MEHSTKKLTLNVNAQAWFPEGHNNQNVSEQQIRSREYRNPAQNRLKQFRAAQFNETRLEQTSTNIKQEADVVADFQYLQGIIARIIADPGHFEEVIDIFMQTLHIHLNSAEMMPQLCCFIFTNAIEEPSFRYNAARLCVLIQEESELFRQILHDLCTKEVEKNIQNPGFTLFLAELNSQGNQGKWKMLYTAVNKLISTGGNENVKAACQSLKLVGYWMEEFDKYMMENVLKALEEEKAQVDRNTSLLIQSVMNLQIHEWGHIISPMSQAEGSSASANNFSNIYMSDTFYGPSGEELTEAERRFLDSELDDYDDPDELYDPEPEMDEEIRAAFKEFVKLGK